MFIVGTPTQIYKFLASSEREKEKWENELKKCIEKEKQAFVEVSLYVHCITTEVVIICTHGWTLYSYYFFVISNYFQSFKGMPIPDEEFLAVSIDAKIDYHQTVDLGKTKMSFKFVSI